MPSSINKQYSFQLISNGRRYDIYYFKGHSGLHDFYRFSLEMIAESKLDCSALISDAGFSIHATVEGDLGRKPHIDFAGKIIRATSLGHRGGNQYGLYLYRLEFVSHIYKLSLSRRYRFFLDKKSTEICQEVMGEDLSSVNDILADSLMERELCSQYSESDLNFVKRVAAADGCFFVNNYKQGSWDMVCGLNYRAEGRAGNSAALEEKAQEVISGMQGMHYDWRTPGFDFLQSEGQAADDYQFYYPDIEKKEGLRSNALKQRVNYEYRNQALWRNSYIGRSEESDVYEGLYYNIQGRKVLVTSAEYEGYEPEKFSNVKDTQGAQNLIRSTIAQGREAYYVCHFTAVNPGASGFVAPLGEKPKIYGVHTGIVVSENGDEINIDAKGCVRVRFHWDQGEEQSEHGICRIRAMSPWSGNGFGMQFSPRKGQEVAVSFIGGDIDRPVITGMLYNAANTPPWDPRQEAWVSGIRTKSVPTNNQKSAYNELSFHDKLNEEKILLRAERDLEVTIGNDLHSEVGGHSYSQIEGNLNESVGGSLKQEVKGSSSMSIRGNSITQVSGFVKETIEGAFSQIVGGKKSLEYRDLELFVEETMREFIRGEANEIIGGALKTRVTKEAVECYEKDFQQWIKGKSTEQVDGDQLHLYAKALHQIIGGSLKIEVEKELQLNAGNGLTLKCGSNMLTIDSSGISQVSQQVAASSDEVSVEAASVEMVDIEIPVFADVRVSKIKAAKNEQEAPGDTVVFELEELEIDEHTEDGKETKTYKFSEISFRYQTLVKWQYVYSNEEKTREETEWQNISQGGMIIDGGKVEMQVNPKNPFEYLHFRCFVSTEKEEMCTKTKLKWVEEFHFDHFADITIEESTKQAVAKVRVEFNGGNVPLGDAQKERVYFVRVMMRSEEDKSVVLGKGSDWLDGSSSGPVRKALEEYDNWNNTVLEELYPDNEHFNIKLLCPSKWENNIAVLKFAAVDYWNKAKLFHFEEDPKKGSNLYLFPIVINKDKKQLHPLLSSRDLEHYAIRPEDTCPFIRPDPYGVYSVLKGTVSFVHHDGNGQKEKDKASMYGNYVIIEHINKTQAMYAHLESFSVALGEEVEAGQHIAVMGNSGRKKKSFKPYNWTKHLHFSLFPTALAGTEINPSWLDKNKNWQRKTLNPKKTIENNHYPTNTKVLLGFNQAYDLKDGSGKIIDSYNHEGIDFSGDFVNDQIPFWEFGLYKEKL